MAWFESWFDSPYYHILYQNRNEEEAEHFLDNLMGYLQLNQKADILDLGCGKGRHSVYLNEKGYDVTGIDLSQSSIEYCQQFENDHLSFFVHDMRKLFRVNFFDCILNLFTTFGYFESENDNLASIKNAALALKNNGILVIDFLNTKYSAQKLIKSHTVVADGINFEITKSFTGKHFIKEINFRDKGEDYRFVEKVQALTLEDFRKYLEPCHLDIIQLFGSYALDNYDEIASPRLIIIAQKKA